ncbi:MAG: hypothetical protein FWH26_11130, partial [Oscillospiraceae bacterium]|nr:hypothetical protein [Oscillospiraceae bacterium]
MLNKQHIQQLKQTNISVNGEATKRHMEKVWKSSSIQQKQAVKALAGISAQTIYRVYNTGSISAKIAIAAA